MKNKDVKHTPRPDTRSTAPPMIAIFVVLCGLSFYLGGMFCSEKHGYLTWDMSKEISRVVVQTYEETPSLSLRLKNITFPECSPDLTDYTPCTDPNRWRKYSFRRLAFLERHCPPVSERKECLVPPPDGYQLPIRWPKSKDECWYRNVPYDAIIKEKSKQHWLKREGEKFLFPGGGTMFPNGVGRYVNLMQAIIPEMRDGTIRTAIDTGCGVASFGSELLGRGILTVSLAPRDNHEAQVQFALERGIPAMLGIIATQRLPFPSNSFDIAHCSRCLIPWTKFGGIYLLELHRIIRTGGFWVLSGPPVNYKHHWRGWNTTVEELRSDLEKLQDMLSSFCFELYKKQGDIAVWRKLSHKNCSKKLEAQNDYPPKCNDETEPDSAWYTPIRPCIAVPYRKYQKSDLASLPKWPQRLHSSPERVSDVRGGSGGSFKIDDKTWKKRVKHYKNLLPAIGTDEIRNVMDMYTLYGGFAAALIDDPVWVMNVVSSYASNTLPVVFDRGLIGTYHDWCEAFSAYPRTYDLLHLDGLFTAESHRCDMKYVLLEMDRILRPTGYAFFRESSYFIHPITTIAEGMRWKCRTENAEDGDDKEKILICQKKLWYSSMKRPKKSLS